MSASNKGPGVDSRLQNLTNALYLDGNNDVVVRTGFAGNIVISGNVNVPGTVTVVSSPENPNHVHLTEVGTGGILTVPWLPVAGNVRLDAGTNMIGNVKIEQMPAISGNVWVNGLTGNISAITQLPAITGNVHVYGGNIQVTQGTTPWTVSGNVTATIADVITVIVDESAGDTFAFNNHAAAVHRGWVMDDTMRPVISVQVRSGFTAADLVKIVEYEIGNNNANQSTIMYEWYEGGRVTVH